MSAPGSKRILLTNNALDARAGTELYVRDVALALKNRRHQPMVFSLEPGEVAAELEKVGIPVVDDLRRVPSVPEVIHGHHLIETTLAAMTFRHVPVVSFCHGPEAWQESPCRLPNVAKWVAVDEACRLRLEQEGIVAERIQVIMNFVDTARFQPRGLLPVVPNRALVLSNYLSASHPATQAIVAACKARGITLEFCGAGFGNACAAPEALLPTFDLVFAKARCALEALACGCAVVQVDHFGAGQMVTLANFNELRPLNFGYQSMTSEATAEHIGAEIDKYDADAALAVSNRLRREASLGTTIGQLEDVYQQVVGFRPPEFDPIVAAADFMRFQLFLSKLPMDAMKKTKGHPLRLPVPPLNLPLKELWAGIRAGHASNAELRVQKLEARLAAQTEKMSTLQAKLAQLKQSHDEQAGHRRGWRKWLGLS